MGYISGYLRRRLVRCGYFRPPGIPQKPRQNRHDHNVRRIRASASLKRIRGRVTAFSEKPQLDGWASAGFMVFPNNRIFEYLDGEDCMLEREPMERLAAEGQLMALPSQWVFLCYGTYREYLYLNDLWNSGKAPWKNLGVK